MFGSKLNLITKRGDGGALTSNALLDDYLKIFTIKHLLRIFGTCHLKCFRCKLLCQKLTSLFQQKAVRKNTYTENG